MKTHYDIVTQISDENAVPPPASFEPSFDVTIRELAKSLTK